MRALVALVLSAAPVFAAPVTVSMVSGDNLVSRIDCQNAASMTVLWTNPVPRAGSAPRVYLTAATDGTSDPLCGESNVTVLEEGNSDESTSGSALFTARQVVDRLRTNCGLDGSSDASAGVEGRILVCVDYAGTGTTERGSQTIHFDTIIPDPPSGVTVIGGDQNLDVSWLSPAASDVAKFRLHFRKLGEVEFDFVEVAGKDTASGTIRELENDSQYEVFVTALDDVENESIASDLATGQPRPVLDFFDVYRLAGGHEEGGCATGGGGGGALALLLGIVGLGFLRRRAALLLVLLALPARAGVEFDRAQRRDPESPQHWALELKAGPYLPAVDSEPGLAAAPGSENKPFAEIFGNVHRTAVQLEVDYQLWHRFGSLAVGQATGFWQTYGKSLLVDGGRSPDATDFNILPNVTLLVYRFDWLAERFDWFPLAPYAKAGLAWYTWWITDANGVATTVAPDDKTASGVTWGYELTAGLMLRLDPLDPTLDREMDALSGVNTASVFFELTRSVVDDFGSSTSFILSDDRWQIGLALEF